MAVYFFDGVIKELKSAGCLGFLITDNGGFSVGF